jgi:protein-S-isoprenylcysteine O-methyltransferase Ste14
MTTSLPTLGPRGEGWVLIQGFLLVAIAAAGMVGPAWSGDLRAVTTAVGLILMAAGAVLLTRGIVDLRENLTALPHPKDSASLVETGAYRLVRHPIYGGIILGSVGWGLVTASPLALGLAAILFGFFDLKSRREEAWLAERFPGYVAYRARTKRFLPWTY